MKYYFGICSKRWSFLGSHVGFIAAGQSTTGEGDAPRDRFPTLRPRNLKFQTLPLPHKMRVWLNQSALRRRCGRHHLTTCRIWSSFQPGLDLFLKSIQPTRVGNVSKYHLFSQATLTFSHPDFQFSSSSDPLLLCPFQWFGAELGRLSVSLSID